MTFVTIPHEAEDKFTNFTSSRGPEARQKNSPEPNTSITLQEYHDSEPSTTIPCIKPLKKDIRSRDTGKQWLFFDDWNVDTAEVKAEDPEYFNHDYDPVDHVSILLGQCSLDESVSLEQGNDEYGPKPAKLISESVWQRRRRAAIFDKGLSTGTGTGTDSIFSKEKPIDNDLFCAGRSCDERWIHLMNDMLMNNVGHQCSIALTIAHETM